MTPCVEWTGPVTWNGYGIDRRGGRRRRAHRIVWENTHGPIPAGLMVLHDCDNRLCINIDHLHLGTHADNMREMAERGRGWGAAITTCPAGHPYDDANTYVNPKGSRECLACRRQRNREYARAKYRRERSR